MIPEAEIPSTTERTAFSRKDSIGILYRKEAKERISCSKAEILIVTSVSGFSIGGIFSFIRRGGVGMLDSKLDRLDR